MMALALNLHSRKNFVLPDLLNLYNMKHRSTINKIVEFFNVATSL